MPLPINKPPPHPQSLKQNDYQYDMSTKNNEGKELVDRINSLYFLVRTKSRFI